ncbi:MAG: multicopper oxidase domain-containing protein [Alicyclobacillus herbarius]|uniref:multicopper oxidase domain-containing protein n=1 Tax=Alicyclobacillus herbarius TaxID=122960 RepID=UPI002356664F|nr:multicopper oxidase domain-containing protein [Alicyclobacillus herbarius]MCL6631466.1 multicopper oxidase domain-containing protein [Alicyclobacillus herbarius]
MERNGGRFRLPRRRWPRPIAYQRVLIFLPVVLLLAGMAGYGIWSDETHSSSANIRPGKMQMDGGSATGKALNQRPVPMKVIRHGHQVHITMVSEETRVQIAPGKYYNAWTFDGTVPGPTLQLQQGDHVTLTLRNLDPKMSHSIDLHAALVSPNQTFVDVPPGKTKTIHFTAKVPGVYMYHCASMPMLQHIGNGMYGAVIVTAPGQPKPDYTIVQSEFYPGGNYDKMKNGQPSYVVFNGKAFQYVSHPLRAKVGKPLTIAFVNAGPNEVSAFHIVGSVLSDVEASGNPKNHFYDVSTQAVVPGEGVLIRVTFQQPGTYNMVTHVMRDADKGATGSIVVT